MKKIFTIVAVLLLAVSVNAKNWVETFDKNGTYVEKTSKSQWPYADQWFTGYTGEKGEVTGSQYVQSYSNVTSFGVSIRSKKVDGATQGVPGLYVAQSKECYVVFSGMNLQVAAGDVLRLWVSNANGDTTTYANWLGVKINETTMTVPSVEIKGDLVSYEVSVALAAGKIDSMKITMSKKTNPLFINRIEIGDPTAKEDTIKVNVTGALDIAKAMTPAIGSTQTTPDIYAVSGYVVGVSTTKTNTYFMADDPDAYGEFQAYQCASIDSEVAEGDYVTVTGKISTYHGQASEEEYYNYEISGGKLVHSTAPLAIPSVMAEKSFNKAIKTIENGRIVIIRNGVKFNAVGSVIE